MFSSCLHRIVFFVDCLESLCSNNEETAQLTKEKATIELLARFLAYVAESIAQDQSAPHTALRLNCSNILRQIILQRKTFIL